MFCFVLFFFLDALHVLPGSKSIGLNRITVQVNDTRAPEGYGRGRKQEVVICQQQSEQCHVVM